MADITPMKRSRIFTLLEHWNNA